MALLLPVVHRARKQAQAVVCQAKLRQWGIAFCAFVGDHDSQMVDGVPQPWCLALKAYCTDYSNMLLCPTVRRRSTNLNVEWATGGTFAPWHYQMPPSPPIVGSYGHNIWLVGQSHDRRAGYSDIPVVFDCATENAYPNHYDDPPAYDGECEFDRGRARNYMRPICLNRHNRGINMLFLNWSVRKVGLK